MLDDFRRALRSAGERRRVAGVAEGEAAGPGIEQAGEDGDEKRLRIVAADFGVGAHENRARIGVVRAQGDALDERLRERHEEARGQAFSRYVAHDEEQPVLVDHEAIVEIAAYRS